MSTQEDSRRVSAFAAARIAEISARVAPIRRRLTHHPIYRRIVDLATLRAFMEHHVFAVWDFMSLLSALRRGVMGHGAVWRPVGPPIVRRFLNDIMAGEESDIDGRGGYLAHFETYLEAMRNAGASTRAIERSVAEAATLEDVPNVLLACGAPRGSVKFSTATFATISRGDVAEIAGSFTFGREEVIPDMFRRLVADLNRAHDHRLERFVFYLDRHIHVDEGDHAPMAMKLLESIGGEDAEIWARIGRGAEDALHARAAFWDDIVRALEAMPREAAAEAS